MPLKEIAREVMCIIGISAVIAIAVNHVSPAKIPLVAQWPSSAKVAMFPPADQIVPGDDEIRTVYRAKEIFDAGKALFVDARGPEYFQNGHIRGAVSLPVAQFEHRIASFKEKYPPGRHIVTYCYSRDCRDSQILAQRLFDAGYTNVAIFVEGYLGWENEGFPIE